MKKNKNYILFFILYFIISSIYIVFSDFFLSLVVIDLEKLTEFQSLKGFLFVVTSTLIFFYYFSKIYSKIEILEEKEKEGGQVIYEVIKALEKPAVIINSRLLIVFANNRFNELFENEKKDLKSFSEILDFNSQRKIKNLLEIAQNKDKSLIERTINNFQLTFLKEESSFDLYFSIIQITSENKILLIGSQKNFENIQKEKDACSLIKFIVKSLIIIQKQRNQELAIIELTRMAVVENYFDFSLAIKASDEFYSILTQAKKNNLNVEDSYVKFDDELLNYFQQAEEIVFKENLKNRPLVEYVYKVLNIDDNCDFVFVKIQGASKTNFLLLFGTTQKDGLQKSFKDVLLVFANLLKHEFEERQSLLHSIKEKEELKKENYQLNLFFDSFEYPAFVLSTDGFLIKVNKKFAIVAESSEENLVGKDLLLYIAPQDLEKTAEKLKTLLKNEVFEIDFKSGFMSSSNKFYSAYHWKIIKYEKYCFGYAIKIES